METLDCFREAVLFNLAWPAEGSLSNGSLAWRGFLALVTFVESSDKVVTKRKVIV